jgi:AraC-like DNA-binding protein
MFPGDIKFHLLHDDTFRRLCRARDLLAASYQRPVALDQAAREACYSPFHFHRLFTAAFGETPHDFLTRRRIDHAKRLLAAGKMTVTEVCFEAGYSSLGSFSTKFHAQVGRAPSDYQREVRRVFGYMAPWRIVVMPGCYLGGYGGMEF